MNELKDTRSLKIIFGKGGSGSTTTRLTLPITYIKQLGITPEERDVIVELDEDKIIIKKK